MRRGTTGRSSRPPTLKHLKLNIEVLDKIDSLVAWKELDTIIREYKKLLEKDEKK